MQIQYGQGKTQYGPGVSINLTGEEVAMAISSYLVAHGVHIEGAQTITVNKEFCESGNIYIDPSGFVIQHGKKISGRGPKKKCPGE